VVVKPDLTKYVIDYTASPEAVKLLRTWLNHGWDYRLDITKNKSMVAQPQVYIDRVEAELELIIGKGFVDYFLVTSDLVRWAKDHGIAVGPGRGSASASVVCYLLRITEIDPVVFDRLMFERFIDPSRNDLPDIDLDFDDERRQEVFDYAAERYGEDKVGKVANFIRYRGKNSIDDVARVYHIPVWEADKVKRLIIERGGGDSREGNSLEDTFAVFPRAREVLDAYPDIAQAVRLEGNYRGMGVHAAGLVISNTPITDACATYTKKDASVIAYDKKDSKYMGFLKLDILGLSTMNVLGTAAEMVGMSLEDIYRIPLDDQKTMAAFHKSDVIGIFQFEGRATRLVCRDVKPDSFQELVDINSLSRPGPLFSGTTANYCDIKHGRAAPKRLHPIVTRETKLTRWQIIFQEQILRIIKEVGGFPLDRVHEIRYIISQKLGEAQFGSFYERFEKGALELHGIDAQLALRIWRFMVTSATYTFVIAHSTGYTIIAWWCQWFKQHHPAAFYAARLRKEADKYKRTKLIKDAMRHGVKVVPPDIIDSGVSWTKTDKRTVCAGFLQIPGVGPKTAQAIVDYLESEVWDTAPTWADLIAVKGIGPKTIERITDFVNDPDPFGINRIHRILEEVREELRAGIHPGIPEPTHTSDDLAEDGSYDVVWVGIPVDKEYKDVVEDERARTDKTTEEILESIDSPELTKLCVVKCIDDGDEDVHCRINRFTFNDFADRLEDLRTNGQDVIIVKGRKRDGFGTNILVKEMWGLCLD